MNSGDPSHLLYDGTIGVFVLLSTNNQMHGSRLLTSAGIKTALTAYSNGYLIAYDPTEITDVEEPNEFVTEINFQLYQNYPNPFNPSTRIQYAISSRQFVQLKVYDILGDEITTLVNEEKPAGRYEVEFNANGHSGNIRNLASGIYFFQLKTGEFTNTKKMILIR
ncbi:MAG: T9SS type A sorting domain-containing protein [Ignavibacteriales bacterium]|nr:T9SS type A sorting domain-containing protein [Ignavibacteriales bacterium]